MGVHIYTSSLRHDVEDARALLDRIDQQVPERLRGKVQAANGLLFLVENDLIEGGAE